MTETLGLTEPLLQTPYSSSSPNHFTLSLSTVFVLYAGLPLPLPPRIPPLTHSSLFFSNIHNLRMQRFSLFLFSHYQNFPPFQTAAAVSAAAHFSLLFHLPHLYRVVLHFFDACRRTSTLYTTAQRALLLLLHHSSQRFSYVTPTLLHSLPTLSSGIRYHQNNLLSKQCQIAVQRCVR